MIKTATKPDSLVVLTLAVQCDAERELNVGLKRVREGAPVRLPPDESREEEEEREKPKRDLHARQTTSHVTTSHRPIKVM